jgi:hypothetical protein
VDGRHASNIMDVRYCRGTDCDSYHRLLQIKYRQRISVYKNIHGARQSKYGIRKFKNMEIINKYKQQIRQWLIESNKEQNNNEETSETKWENIKQVVTMVASKLVGCGERTTTNDWCHEEYQIKVEERNDT